MAESQNIIEIKFKATDAEKLEKAVKSLDKATKSLVNAQAKLVKQNNANRMRYQTLTAQSAQAQNNLWNFYRDSASWLMTTAENREQRSHDAAMLAAQISGNKDLYRTEFLNNLLLEVGMNL